MGAFIDLSGQQFGRLLALRRASSPGKTTRWECLCECGKKVTVAAGALRSKHTRSCGCLQSERAISANTRHGHSHSPTYRSWQAMVRRCTNPAAAGFKEYGERGITVCRRWSKFANFLADMGERPEGKTLDRKKINLGYSPSNCRWATRAEQARNTSRNVWLTHNGKKQILADWAAELKIGADTISARLKKMSVAEALTPTQKGTK